MSEQDEGSLIGYDPLAWLQQPEEQQDAEQTTGILEMSLEDNEQEAIVSVDDAEIQPIAEDSADEEALPSAAVKASIPMEHSHQQIVLEPVQNIQNVAQLHDRLLCVLDSANKIDIDASAITAVDTATLQLLLVLKQAAVKMQKEVNIDFPSEKFIEAAGLLGLAEMLDVDNAAAGFF